MSFLFRSKTWRGMEFVEKRCMMAEKKNSFLQGIERFMSKFYDSDKIQRIMSFAWERYEELVAENQNEPKAMYIHTRERIYPGIAVFDSMIREGIAREEAARMIIDFYRWRSEKVARVIRKMFKVPMMYKIAPKLFYKATTKSFGKAAGFEANFYETSKDLLRFDMTVCPYYNICKKYGCPEIVAAYCEADDVCYGDMHPYLKWERTKTLGKGGDCCDFCIRIAKY